MQNAHMCALFDGRIEGAVVTVTMQHERDLMIIVLRGFNLGIPAGGWQLPSRLSRVRVVLRAVTRRAGRGAGSRLPTLKLLGFWASYGHDPGLDPAAGDYGNDVTKLS